VSEIRKVAVLGAGVMGAGIAAQIANAGIKVRLLDIVPAGANNRNAIAEGAIARMLKTDPAPFMHRDVAKAIEPGNIEDHIGEIADCDWIVEAVVEKLDLKQELYRKVDKARRPGSVVSSNTSTIPLADLTAGLPDSFARDFCITHFFNPPRYMRLLEIVAGKTTRPDAIKTLTEFGDRRLGKAVVNCKDRPGFIGNRLGIYWLQTAIAAAIELGLTVEEADAVAGRPFGIPKTGVFGLVDLVGLDLMPHVVGSMLARLPESDPVRRENREVKLIQKMIAEGLTGRKGKGGFYRLNDQRVKEAIDLNTGTYRTATRPRIEALDAAGKDLMVLMSHPDPAGRYAWQVMGRTLVYAAMLVPEAADDVFSIDEAMRLGYNWRFGPFELIDQVGADWLAERLAAEGHDVPALLKTAKGKKFYRIENGARQFLGTDGQYRNVVRADGVLLLADIKLRSKPIFKNGSAALWDIGDGVACLEFTSKMNSMDAEIMGLLQKSIREVKSRFKALVLYNEGENFSVGANLGLALFAANIAAWPEIENLIATGQQTYKALKYAPFPVVAAPFGLTLGGGCEIVLHSHAVQAHAETYIGLVEAGVGVVPAWGGCKEMLARWAAAPKMPRGPMPPIVKTFETISTATVAKSALEAKELQFLRPTDGVTMSRSRLLADAKARALSMVATHKPPMPPTYRLPGPTAKVAMGMAVDGFRKLGKALPHDVTVSGELAYVLSGGKTDIMDELKEDDILTLEREAIMRLFRHPLTLARIEHTLDTGKPLRN
jgi:3-hydroxyacyl-CoA dehydrogenase